MDGSSAAPVLAARDAAVRIRALALPQRRHQPPRQAVPGDPASASSAVLETLNKAVNNGSPMIAIIGEPAARRALAARWMQDVASSYPAGHIYLDVADERRGSVADVGDYVGDVLRTLGVAEQWLPATLGERHAMLGEITVRQPLLIILDSVQHPTEGDPLACPGSLLIVLGDHRLAPLLRQGTPVVDLASPAVPEKRKPEPPVPRLSRRAHRLMCLLSLIADTLVSRRLIVTAEGRQGSRALEELVDKGLVAAALTCPDRFRLTDPALEYVRNRTHMRKPEASAARRLAAALLLVSDQVVQNSDGERSVDGSTAALEWLDGERAAFVAVMRHASVLAWHSTVWKLALNLESLYERRVRRDRTADRIDSLRLGIEAAFWDGAIDTHLFLRARLADVYCRSGYLDEAMEQADRAVGLMDRTVDDSLRGLITGVRARVNLAGGRAEALDELEQSRQWYERAGAPEEADAQTCLLGRALVMAGRSEEALETLCGTDSARAAIARATAYQALGDVGRTLGSAVSGAEHAAEGGDYPACQEALYIVACAARREDETELLDACLGKLQELRCFTGPADTPSDSLANG
ncbi:hypothetical protein AB0P17_24365 [Streptomyces sp. NPDC088124]|uniref:hypothetical protein n=1 Tax=Streptomyces sp. NPDC088124 TaxID=3154654 RepID=UPI0034487EF7